MASAGQNGHGLRVLLLEGLTPRQQDAVMSDRRRLLVVAGAGSGKTELMSRRIAWDVGVRGIPRESIVAFTFTERAAEEMQFRIRRHLARLSSLEGDTTLGGMYVGTIHAFCLKGLRDLAPDTFHNYDVLEDGARIGLVERRFWNLLAGRPLQDAFSAEGIARGHFATIERFLHAYDLLNEYHLLDVGLPEGTPPGPGPEEEVWCAQARLRTNVGTGAAAKAFAASAARFYALLRCRRFLDFSTSQAELLRLLEANTTAREQMLSAVSHLVVDEVQDINPVQTRLIEALLGGAGRLTAVGDHRQAIFGWRGGGVDIMGALHDELDAAPDGEIVELEENFRSTPRIIQLANGWARTITPPGEMRTPDMSHGRAERTDYDSSHVAIHHFEERADEAEWIAETISRMVAGGEGARHDVNDGERGLRLADIAILTRSATDARAYGEALRRRGLDCVFRGSDLFAQAEVLFFLAALARIAGLEQFFGRQLQTFIDRSLGADHTPDAVLHAAAAELRRRGLPLSPDRENDVLRLADHLHGRVMEGSVPTKRELAKIKSTAARPLLAGGDRPRRVFPQALLHCLLEEAEVASWDELGTGAETVMFHLGALSSLVTTIETPGWTRPNDLRFQVIGLCMWGPAGTRLPEADLLTSPDAVSIGTIHSAKGLEWPAVFVADINARRFPNQRAKTRPALPFQGNLARAIDPAHLADNDNYDGERRLMYVALTRAERYLFASCSGKQSSRFRGELEPLVAGCGGVVDDDPAAAPTRIELREGSRDADAQRLVSSFSDLRYFLECPHDFYLRKVLGFAPTIDQTFGYGRGVHNLMRAVHWDSARWAKLAGDRSALESELRRLVADGLFYLRYTVGEPQENMQRRGVEIVADYVETYAEELTQLTFEPEREFETLLEDEQVLISGAIDVVRRDDPPRVTLLDFKSGEPDSDVAMKLDADEMRLQVSLYGLAARAELEYEPERGLVRYLAEQDPDERELDVPLTEQALKEAAETVAETARRIKARDFHAGPAPRKRDDRDGPRCDRCDFKVFCGVRRHVGESGTSG